MKNIELDYDSLDDERNSQIPSLRKHIEPPNKKFFLTVTKDDGSRKITEDKSEI